MRNTQKPASVFRKMYHNVLESRAREANRHINRALKMMDDEGLIARGLNRDHFNRHRAL